MAVAGVDVGAEPSEIERQLAGSVGAVHDCHDARIAGPPNELIDRKHERRIRRDVADEQRARALAEPFADGVDDLCRTLEGEWDRGAHVARPGARTGVLPHKIARAVLEVDREHFVAGSKFERPRHDVDCTCRVQHEDEIVRVRAHVRRERRARFREQAGEASREKVHGLPFELVLPRLIPLEHRPRASAVGTVIEVGDLSVEHEQLADGHRDEPRAAACPEARRPCRSAPSSRALRANVFAELRSSPARERGHCGPPCAYIPD